jgi:hypothetical protein
MPPGGRAVVVGTSGIVQPAASLPYLAKEFGAHLIDVNPNRSGITAIADVWLEGPSGRYSRRSWKRFDCCARRRFHPMRNERIGWRRFVWLIVAAGLAVGGGGGAAVRAQQVLSDLVEVYVMLAPPDGQAGLARVYFIRMVTGDVLSADVRGGRFTLVGEYVLYEDPDTRALYRLWPDGRTEHHPFIQPAPETERIDWVVSPDGQWIAWMLTNRQADGQLQSVTTLARWDGTQPQIILTDGAGCLCAGGPDCPDQRARVLLRPPAAGRGGFLLLSRLCLDLPVEHPGRGDVPGTAAF